MWTLPDGQYQNQIGYILCSQRWRSSIQLAKTRRGADCGSDHELLIGEKERYTHLNAEFQRIAGEIRKPSSVISEKK